MIDTTLTISERLKSRLREKQWSTRQFQKAVEEIAPGARGVSYASVYEYVEGNTPDPPLPFLRAAAHVLGVRLAWLIDRDGAPTWAEETAARVSQAATPSLETMFRSAIPDWTWLGPAARQAVVGTWAELCVGLRPDELIEERGQLRVTKGGEVARALGQALSQPLGALGLGGVLPPEIDTYTVLLCEALQVYARGHRRAMNESRNAYAEEEANNDE